MPERGTGDFTQMTEGQRRTAYEACQQRGHESNGTVLTSNPPWFICRYCGTKFQTRTETHVFEYDVPGGERT